MENSCLIYINELEVGFQPLVYYSHLIPVGIALVLILFTLFKSKLSFVSIIFSAFAFGFCLWLIGDVIVWEAIDYNLISFVWASLDYINILFFLFGAYFFLVIKNNGSDISIWNKYIFVALALPVWWLSFANHSIEGFNAPLCEAINNGFLTEYKLFLEIFVIFFII